MLTSFRRSLEDRVRPGAVNTTDCGVFMHRISGHPNLLTARDIAAALALVRGAGHALCLVAQARALLLA